MTDDILAPTKIHPFPLIFNLNSKGGRADKGDTVVARVALMICPNCGGLDDFYNCTDTTHYKSQFCQGGQPPVCEHTETNILTGEKRETSHPVRCAGIIEEHLHVMCFCCQESFLVYKPREEVIWGR